MTSAFTYHELEKIASAFDLDVGQLLLLETNNLRDVVLVGSRRTIYFSTETGEQSRINHHHHHPFERSMTTFLY